MLGTYGHGSFPDLRRRAGGAWPAAREALRALPIGALYAFPLFVGNLDVGTVDLYCVEPRQLAAGDIEDVTVLAAVASRHLLRRALNTLDTVEEGMTGGPHSRLEMHQASGMIAAQLGVGVDDALLILRGRAFSSGRTVGDVAGDVVRGDSPSSPDSEPRPARSGLRVSG